MAFTADEKASYQIQLAKFFSSNTSQGDTADKRKRTAARAKAIPRAASLDSLRCLENSMKFATGFVLKTFDSQYLLASAETKDGVVKVPKCESVFGPDRCPNILVLNSDRCPVQLCSINYLLHRLKLNCAFVCDPSHAAWRSVLDGLGASGHNGVLSICQVLFNIAYGPLQKSGFFKILQEATADMSVCLTPNDSLLLWLWPRVCAEMGFTTAEQTGEEGRRAYVANLILCESGTMKGPKVSNGRFYSFNNAYQVWNRSWHTKLLIIAWVSVRLGWSKSFRDFYPTRASSASADSAVLAKASSSASSSSRASTAGASSSSTTSPGSSSMASSSSSSGAASSSSSAIAGPGSSSTSSAAPGPSSISGVGSVLPSSGQVPKSLPQAKELAREATNVERARSQNTLHAVGRFLANDDLLRQVRMVGAATTPLAQKYGAAYHDIKGMELTRDWYAGWAHWSRGVKQGVE